MVETTRRSHAVVVLNYNGREDTLRCLESLTGDRPEVAVIVVDNGSTDGLLDEVGRRWPTVERIQTGSNLGFSGGMNVGLRHALDQFDIVTVLNNDTVVPAGAMSRLATTAHASKGLVSPLIAYLGTTDHLWFGGGLIDDRTGLPRHATAAEVAAVRTDQAAREVEVLAGACLTATADTWRRLGLFDEWFFLTFEDSELSLRARALGIPLLVDDAVTIEHAVSASFTGAFAYLGLYYYSRNGLRFVRRDSGRSWLTTARFVRAHVVPAVTSGYRKGGAGEAARRAQVVARAMTDFTRGRGGRAGSALQRRAERWASRP